MDYNLKILPSAEFDIDEAIQYYSKISESVLENFNTRLDEALLRIETNPFFQKRFKNIHALPLKRFPYIIFLKFLKIPKLFIFSPFSAHTKTLKNIHRIY